MRKKFLIVAGLALIAILIAILGFASSAFAKGNGNTPNHGNSGSTKTTDDEGTVNQNHYKPSDEVYLDGSGFDPGTYNYNIYTNPPSVKKGNVVSSGTITVDLSGEFNSQVWTIPDDADKGPYKIVLDTEKGRKQDNFLVKVKPEEGEESEEPEKPKEEPKPIGGGIVAGVSTAVAEGIKELPKAGAGLGTVLLILIFSMILFFKKIFKHWSVNLQ